MMYGIDLRPAGLFLIAFAVGACMDPASEAVPAAPAPGDSADVFVQLTAVKFDSMRAAFDRAAVLPLTIEVRSEQLGPDGEVIAIRQQSVVRSRTADSVSVSATTAGEQGAFRLGLLGKLAAEPDFEHTGETLGSILPEDAAYLSPRSRENFIYALLPDTTVNGAVVSGIEVHADQEASEQPLRLARIYFDPVTRQAVRYELTRRKPDFLFRERTHALVEIAAQAGRGNLPARTLAETAIKLPLTGTRRFRVSKTFHFANEGSGTQSVLNGVVAQ